MVDGDDLDDKVVTVSTMDPFYRHVRSLNDIPDSLIRELTYFFENYKNAEGKETKVERWDDVDEAKRIIMWSMDQYTENEG
jgi:inorganic pyrophosphatase